MKKILITGAAGMIAKELPELLLSKDKNAEILGADLKFYHDLREYETCKKFCEGVDEIYHLAGVRSNPRFTKTNPVDFLLPMLSIDSNMIRAALENNVGKFLYTSSIGVFYDTDKYSAYAKQVGERLIEAIKIQYPDRKFCVVRPSNCYGRFENFARENNMVVSDLIRKALTSSRVEVWGNGDETRDFLNARDVARWMVEVMEKMPIDPVNLYTGTQHSIFEVVKIIEKNTGANMWFNMETEGKLSKPMPPNINFNLSSPTVTLEDGIKEAIEYARKQLQ